jgi:Zn-dependent peptidase ImmA (M78 family)
MRRLYVPVSLTLPYGYRIQIRLVTDSEMLQALDEEDNKAELVDGLWDSEARLILIRKSLAKARQIRVFAHELHHALADWEHAISDELNLQP